MSQISIQDIRENDVREITALITIGGTDDSPTMTIVYGGVFNDGRRFTEDDVHTITGDLEQAVGMSLAVARIKFQRQVGNDRLVTVEDVPAEVN